MTAVEQFWKEISEIIPCKVDSVVALKVYDKLKEAKEMEEEQRGYSESDMRSYASYILNNPVIEPSQWYKIYRTK